MRLNGWQRIGIVASVLWVIGGGIWGNSLGLAPGEYVAQAYEQCLLSSYSDREACSARFERDWPEAIKYHWHLAAAFAFLPIPLAWLAVGGLVILVRWIRAGFTQ
jgi:hypothetical protein